MKLKKKYRFDNKRQIWRIIPTNEGKLILEEREPEKKQAYFHCLAIDSGKKILSNFQLDDKFWVGIEAVKDDTIFFHKFAKPDMPKHRGIFAFDLKAKELIWQNPELVFLFLLNDKIFTYKEKFEGRYYYSIDSTSGEIIDDLGNDYKRIESLTNGADDGYIFPEAFDENFELQNRAGDFIKSLRNNFVISGKIEYISVNDLLLLSFHSVNSKGTLDNIFKAVDLSKGKYILEELINKETSLFLTDSFFIKDDLLFLLFGKTRLVVYKMVN